VNGVRAEVENQGRLLGGARFSTVAAAARERERGDDGRQRRGDPSHSAVEDRRAGAAATSLES
jgi:hypothetical protein